VKVRNCFVRC